MFADFTCDDTFQIETRKLCLRWPRAADAAAIAVFASLSHVAQMTAHIPHPYPIGEAERFVLRARAENAAGQALTLAIVQKSNGRNVIGLVSANFIDNATIEVGYVVAPAAAGRGHGTDAVRALVKLVFGLTHTARIVANCRIANLASRRVLEKCGFVYVDTGLDLLPARGGLHPCDRFRLDRRAWAARHPARRIPAMVQQQGVVAAVPADEEAARA